MDVHHSAETGIIWRLLSLDSRPEDRIIGAFVKRPGQIELEANA